MVYIALIAWGLAAVNLWGTIKGAIYNDWSLSSRAEDACALWCIVAILAQRLH